MDRFAPNQIKELLLEEDFCPASARHWIVETDAAAGQTLVSFDQGRLDAQSTAGYTVWLKQEFSGNYGIEYTVDFILDGAAHERLSDLNCFWSASDPQQPDDFFHSSAKRGTFASYNPLQLYYLGYGGNDNTTTRFRKYCGRHKDVITEYTDKKHLLTPGCSYQMRLEMSGDSVRFFVNGEQIVHYQDQQRYPKGYFAFRSIRSHVQISQLRVVQFF